MIEKTKTSIGERFYVRFGGGEVPPLAEPGFAWRPARRWLDGITYEYCVMPTDARSLEDWYLAATSIIEVP